MVGWWLLVILIGIGLVVSVAWWLAYWAGPEDPS